MRRTLLIILAVVTVLGIGGYLFLQNMFKNTKKASPEQTVTLASDNIGADVSIFYCRPSKKGRDVFGALVPYGQWWRTGANEPTTFTTSKDLDFSGQTLKAGKYHLVTVPEANEWTVVFNTDIPMWGTIYTPEKDLLRVKAPVQTLPTVTEMFTITFENTGEQNAIAFAWDRTKVVVPFVVK